MLNSQPSRALEQLPNFLAFLAQRLGVETAVATDVLGEALVQYEPGPIARARGATPPVKARAKRTDAPAEGMSRQAAAA